MTFQMTENLHKSRSGMLVLSEMETCCVYRDSLCIMIDLSSAKVMLLKNSNAPRSIMNFHFLYCAFLYAV